MVVRPQRGGLLPHRWIPWYHVLLHSETRGATGLFVSALHRAFLDVDLPLHLGGTPSPALHRVARLGANTRNDLLHYALDALVGRHDQRAHDALGRLGQ